MEASISISSRPSARRPCSLVTCGSRSSSLGFARAKSGLDGAALAEAFETIRGIRDDGRAFTVVGFECAMHFESEDGEHVTLKANLASIKVKVVPFRALVRQLVDLS